MKNLKSDDFSGFFRTSAAIFGEIELWNFASGFALKKRRYVRCVVLPYTRCIKSGDGKFECFDLLEERQNRR